MFGSLVLLQLIQIHLPHLDIDYDIHYLYCFVTVTGCARHRMLPDIRDGFGVSELRIFHMLCWKQILELRGLFINDTGCVGLFADDIVSCVDDSHLTDCLGWADVNLHGINFQGIYLYIYHHRAPNSSVPVTPFYCCLFVRFTFCCDL